MSVPVCTAEPLELGGGITDAELRLLDGEPEGVRFMHPCIEGRVRAAWVPIGRAGGWTLVQRSPLTLSPSVLCRSCGFHGFIRNGKWVRA